MSLCGREQDTQLTNKQRLHRKQDDGKQYSAGSPIERGYPTEISILQYCQ